MRALTTQTHHTPTWRMQPGSCVQPQLWSTDGCWPGNPARSSRSSRQQRQQQHCPAGCSHRQQACCSIRTAKQHAHSMLYRKHAVTPSSCSPVCSRAVTAGSKSSSTRQRGSPLPRQVQQHTRRAANQQQLTPGSNVCSGCSSLHRHQRMHNRLSDSSRCLAGCNCHTGPFIFQPARSGCLIKIHRSLT